MPIEINAPAAGIPAGKREGARRRPKNDFNEDRRRSCKHPMLQPRGVFFAQKHLLFEAGTASPVCVAFEFWNPLTPLDFFWEQSFRAKLNKRLNWGSTGQHRVVFGVYTRVMPIYLQPVALPDKSGRATTWVMLQKLWRKSFRKQKLNEPESRLILTGARCWMRGRYFRQNGTTSS